jgi:hypothetical protein
MRAATPWFLLLGLAAGCLDLERTPGDPLAVDASAAPDGGATDAADPNWILDADLSDVFVGDCVNACINAAPSPEAAALFTGLSHCASGAPARSDMCADACVPGLPLDEPSTCPAPGSFADEPACNACVKDLCCPLLTLCFANADCIQVGLCANRCPR